MLSLLIASSDSTGISGSCPSAHARNWRAHSRGLVFSKWAIDGTPIESRDAAATAVRCSSMSRRRRASTEMPCAVFRQRSAGGERGIRTLDRVSPIHAFQACAFNHSAISPTERCGCFFRIACGSANAPARGSSAGCRRGLRCKPARSPSRNRTTAPSEFP